MKFCFVVEDFKCFLAKIVGFNTRGRLACVLKVKLYLFVENKYCFLKYSFIVAIRSFESYGSLIVKVMFSIISGLMNFFCAQQKFLLKNYSY